MRGQSQSILLVEESKDGQVSVNCLQFGCFCFYLYRQLLLDFIDVFGTHRAVIAIIVDPSTATAFIVPLSFTWEKDLQILEFFVLLAQYMEYFIALPAFLIGVVAKISAMVAFVLQIFISHAFQAILEVFSILLLVNFRVSDCFLDLLLSIFPVFFLKWRTSASVDIAAATSHLTNGANPMKIALCCATE